MTTATAPSLPRVRSRNALLTGVLCSVIAALLTVLFCLMPSMRGGMEMPGHWTMSMAWMPMPGQSPAAAATMFLAMWTAMMVAMMLPSALPTILLYRRVTAFRDEGPLATWAMAAAYFAVWTAFGVVAYAIGLAICGAAMRSASVSRAVPFATGAALIASGLYQLTPWKSSCLNHCRDPLTVVACHLHDGARGAVRAGLYHGFLCALCCWPLMVIQLSLGVMDLLVMTTIAAVIAMEKLLRAGPAIARAVGVGAIVLGAFFILRALWPPARYSRDPRSHSSASKARR